MSVAFHWLLWASLANWTPGGECRNSVLFCFVFVFCSSKEILEAQTSDRIWSGDRLVSPPQDLCGVYCCLQSDNTGMSWIRGYPAGALCSRVDCQMLGRNAHTLWNHRSDLHQGPIVGEAGWVSFLCSGPVALKCLLGCFSVAVKGEMLRQSCEYRQIIMVAIPDGFRDSECFYVHYLILSPQ